MACVVSAFNLIGDIEGFGFNNYIILLTGDNTYCSE